MTINRTVLREQIKEFVLSRIMSGAYAPGERLIETQIAQELGTSQTPVREALRDLESMRLVESQAFKGTRVRAISEVELAEIYPVRAALEELAGQQAALRLGGRTELLQVEYDGMLRAAQSRDLHAQVHHDVEFHRLIVEASGNRTLAEVWASLRIEARTMITALRTDTDLDMMARLHKPILDAIGERDPEKTGTAMRCHFETFATLLLKRKDGHDTTG